MVNEGTGCQAGGTQSLSQQVGESAGSHWGLQEGLSEDMVWRELLKGGRV